MIYTTPAHGNMTDSFTIAILEVEQRKMYEFFTCVVKILSALQTKYIYS